MIEWISIKENGPPLAGTRALFTDGRDNLWTFYALTPKRWATHYMIPTSPPITLPEPVIR